MTSARLLLLLPPCLGLAIVVATVSPLSQAAEPLPKGCVSIHVDAIHDGLGYQHYAEADNACSKPVRCRLWTNVDPTPHFMTLAPGARDDVVFRRGSPAHEFRAFAECVFTR